MVQKNNRGFGTVETVLILVILGLLGLVGWLIYRNQPTDTPTTSSKTTTTVQKTTTEAPAPAVSVERAAQTDSSSGVKYSVPSGWEGLVKVEKFAADSAIHVGYGAPVWVRYSTSAKTWQTLDNDANNQPTEVRADSLVTASDKKVEHAYPAGFYTTGESMSW